LFAAVPWVIAVVTAAHPPRFFHGENDVRPWELSALGRTTVLTADVIASGAMAPAETESAPHSGAAFTLLGIVQAALTAAIALTLLALPAIQRELGLSRADLVLVSAAPGLSFSGLLLLGGRLADMYGWRRVFIIGLAIFGIASAAAGIAPTSAVLLAARFAQGCGAALAAPAAMALLGAIFPQPDARSRAVAIWGNLAPLGAAAGTLLSGIIVTWVSWRWAFAIPVLVALVAGLATPRLLPAGPSPAAIRLDVPGALLVTAGLTLLSYGLVQIGEYPWPAAPVLIPLVGGAALLAAFVAVESRVPAPLAPLTFFASARRSVALLIVLLVGAVSASLFFMLALYFLQVRHWSPLLTSAAFLPIGVALFASGAVAGRVIGGVGSRVVTAGGLAIGAAGLLLLNRLDVAAPYAGTLLAGLFIFQAGAGFALAGATVESVAGVPEDEAGLAGGILNASQQIGPTVGVAILVTLATVHSDQLTTTGLEVAKATTSGYAYALGIAAATFALAAVISFVTLRR
jgi:MFS family permease